jgi:hypothetical protein
VKYDGTFFSWKEKKRVVLVLILMQIHGSRRRKGLPIILSRHVENANARIKCVHGSHAKDDEQLFQSLLSVGRNLVAASSVGLTQNHAHRIHRTTVDATQHRLLSLTGFQSE